MAAKRGLIIFSKPIQSRHMYIHTYIQVQIRSTLTGQRQSGCQCSRQGAKAEASTKPGWGVAAIRPTGQTFGRSAYPAESVALLRPLSGSISSTSPLPVPLGPVLGPVLAPSSGWLSGCLALAPARSRVLVLTLALGHSTRPDGTRYGSAKNSAVVAIAIQYPHLHAAQIR